MAATGLGEVKGSSVTSVAGLRAAFNATILGNPVAARYIARATRRCAVLVRAVAAPEATRVFTKEFPMGSGHSVKVTVEEEEGGNQRITLFTARNGKMILHWGVEGGSNYQGGWRLPGEGARPEGTVVYKNRALQTPWKGCEGGQQLVLLLQGDEASDYLDFVVKDDATGTWYDLFGENFQVPLRAAGQAGAAPEDALLPDNQLPELPGELCGIWSYIKWEQAGCPNRSGEESDREYHVAIAELKDLLRRRHSLDELWRVARGEEKYHEFRARTLDAPAVPAQAPPQEQQQQEAPPAQEQQKAPAAEQQQAEAPAAKEAQGEVAVGKSIGTQHRNPLDMIKSQAPKLSGEKSRKVAKILDPLRQEAAVDDSCVWSRSYPLGGKSELFVAVRQAEGKKGPVQVTLTTDQPSDVVLHWGIKSKEGQWIEPPAGMLPKGSSIAEGTAAADTKFDECDAEECVIAMASLDETVPLQRVSLTFPPGHDFSGIMFVLRSGDGSMWWRDGGGNFNVPVPGKKEVVKQDDPTAGLDEPGRTIVDCEVKADQWTLMHRFNKAADLLSQHVNGDPEAVANAMAQIYVWLRYSSIRQLTWQRNYNTQPRILGEAQGRVTHIMAESHAKTSGEAQEWVRLMLTTVGRGGNAQAVRDEILNIMHRHHLPEVKGTFLEEFHQKLHNNTTPDDIHICAAYIAFMEAKGDNGAFWRVLSDAGVTRERMHSFDRAIVTEPEYFADKAGALIPEFRNYLKILNAVHSGADLQASAEAAGGQLPEGAKGHLGYVLAHQADAQVLPLIESAVEARTELHNATTGNRELLYLDLSLEGLVRTAAERGAGAAGAGAAPLVAPLLANLALSLGDNEEVCYCLKAWQDLPAAVRSGSYPAKDDALKAMAVLDRVRRALADTSDRISARIEPISSAFGAAFGCEPWAVELFAEEVVRGGPAFAVSLVLSSIEPTFRAAAELGAWQLISPGDAVGRVVVVNAIHEVQDKVYDEPTVLLAKRVTGEEEVPEGAVAVLTPDAPDVLSHLSVRARNMRVLFAICHEDGPLEEIEALAGQFLAVKTSAAGGVSWEVAQEGDAVAEGGGSKPKTKIKVVVPKWSGKWVVPIDEFKDGVVGAKSKNIAGMRGKIPDNISLPASITVPYGTFEEVLAQPANKDIKKQLEAKVKTIPDSQADAILKECAELAMQVKIPDVLKDALAEAMAGAGFTVPDSPERWEAAFAALKGVWASKFNERAFLSMRKMGLSFMDIRMAVLVQRVVPAQYAFVIHTQNPSSGNPDEVYCELVRGLGESIVSGTVPGSAMAFIANKSNLDEPEILLYPSKSDGMFVDESLIFRSDSNGEDLEGYAGAGLYDSITMDPTRLAKVDYQGDPLLTEPEWCKALLVKVCKVGAAIEAALGSPQDIEGVVDPDGNITVVQTRPQM